MTVLAATPLNFIATPLHNTTAKRYMLFTPSVHELQRHWCKPLSCKHNLVQPSKATRREVLAAVLR